MHASLDDLRRADAALGSAAVALRRQALIQLSDALPLAAIAAGEDTEWQALDATLSETSRVPERNLVHALSAQCAPLGGG